MPVLLSEPIAGTFIGVSATCSSDDVIVTADEWYCIDDRLLISATGQSSSIGYW